MAERLAKADLAEEGGESETDLGVVGEAPGGSGAATGGAARPGEPGAHPLTSPATPRQGAEAAAAEPAVPEEADVELLLSKVGCWRWAKMWLIHSTAVMRRLGVMPLLRLLSPTQPGHVQAGFIKQLGPYTYAIPQGVPLALGPAAAHLLWSASHPPSSATCTRELRAPGNLLQALAPLRPPA